MAFKSVNAKSGSLAFVKEVVQGTPVAPTLATDFTAIQDDISMNPGIETADNVELKNSIMPGQSIIIGEAPTGSVSHYLRPSGVLAQAPDFSLLLEAGLGKEKIVAVEETVLVGSTVSDILVTDASEYEKGDTILIQSSTGYELRPISSVSGNTITLAFDLANVPSTGAGISRPVTYQLENDSNAIPTLTAHYFLPNVYQMMAGCRVVSVDATFTAKDLINCSFGFEGVGFYYNALTVDATNDSLDFFETATEYNLTIANKVYSTPVELAEAIESAMNAAGSGVTFLVTYSKDGFFTVTGDGNFDLLWNTGVNNATSIGGLLGYDVVSDDTGTASYTGDSEIDLSSGLTPQYDALGPLAGKGNVTFLGTNTDNICLNAQEVSYSIANSKSDLNDLCAASGVSASIFSERTNEISITAYLQPYEADKFAKLRNGEVVSFFHGAGNKSGGQFKLAECVGVYCSHAVINNLELSQSDGISIVTYTLAAFAPDDSTQPSFIGFC